jgi:hypothetical protein
LPAQQTRGREHNPHPKQAKERKPSQFFHQIVSTQHTNGIGREKAGDQVVSGYRPGRLLRRQRDV